MKDDVDTGSGPSVVCTPATKAIDPASITKIEESMNKLVSGFVCRICLDLYDSPVITKCFHKFCRKCINNHIEDRRRKKKDPFCPLCKEKIGRRDLSDDTRTPKILLAVKNVARALYHDTNSAIPSPFDTGSYRPVGRPSMTPAGESVKLQKVLEFSPIRPKRSSTCDSDGPLRKKGKKEDSFVDNYRDNESIVSEEPVAGEDLEDPACRVCGVDDDKPAVICDKCEGVHHFKCVKIKRAPKGDWYCSQCHKSQSLEPSEKTVPCGTAATIGNGDTTTDAPKAELESSKANGKRQNRNDVDDQQFHSQGDDSEHFTSKVAPIGNSQGSNSPLHDESNSSTDKVSLSYLSVDEEYGGSTEGTANPSCKAVMNNIVQEKESKAASSSTTQEKRFNPAKNIDIDDESDVEVSPSNLKRSNATTPTCSPPTDNESDNNKHNSIKSKSAAVSKFGYRRRTISSSDEDDDDDTTLGNKSSTTSSSDSKKIAPPQRITNQGKCNLNSACNQSLSLLESSQSSGSLPEAFGKINCSIAQNQISKPSVALPNPKSTEQSSSLHRSSLHGSEIAARSLGSDIVSQSIASDVGEEFSEATLIEKMKEGRERLKNYVNMLIEPSQRSQVEESKSILDTDEELLSKSEDTTKDAPNTALIRTDVVSDIADGANVNNLVNSKVKQDYDNNNFTHAQGITPSPAKRNTTPKKYSGFAVPLTFKTTPTKSPSILLSPRKRIGDVTTSPNSSHNEDKPTQTKLPVKSSVVVLVTGLPHSEKRLQKRFRTLLGKLNHRIVNEFDATVTHIVTDVDPDTMRAKRRTMKLMRAISEGKWVLSLDWAKRCLEKNDIVHESDFEAVGAVCDPVEPEWIGGPRRSREAVARGEQLLTGWKIFATDLPKGVDESEIAGLIESMGAKALASEPTQFDPQSKSIIVVGRESLRIHDSSAPIPICDLEFLFDCISSFRVQPIENYLMEEEEDPSQDLL